MCTVLQQTLGDRGRDFRGGRQVSPVRPYLADLGSLKRPIDPSDRKISHPNMHFHLYGRSHSASRTGMRLLVDYMRSTTPRPKSPHMNNEEPIGLAHYPDGKVPPEDMPLPIERDDFPAPPFLGTGKRRHRSEPGLTPLHPHHLQLKVRRKMSPTHLKKISSGMGQIFLTEIAMEKERRKGKTIDPRSAARSPAANKEPLFRLRYESPINASPSRIADHLHPWEEPGRRACIMTPITPKFSPFESTKIETEDDDDVSDDIPITGSGPRSVYFRHPISIPHISSSRQNYRLPGDVDRCNLEKHLSDEYFDMLFDCSRIEFYQLPYWKRCELKKKNLLF
ncbi:Actin-binding LIM protein 1 [Caligus rogercresseyi]|uniref:Actin-binding LIM protein 1 n=1 Tax=Caligus rogercresseyi TaxID=217165 RepID=A0A7T8HGR6_CALRO|nr:Actin-binding LIM protein 1 [Caligus rogercresseyi]